MREIPSKKLHWMQEELSQLERAEVLDADTVARVRGYYADQTTTSGGAGLAVVIFSILGALLIGGGIILLFAHNWENLSRDTRALLSFMPLVCASVLSYVALLRNGQTALRESAGLFHALAIGAAIALIGQTYHLPSNVPGFLMIWALLAAPLMFILLSASVAIIYLALITGWCGVAQSDYGQALGYWAFLIPVCIYLALLIRDDRHAPKTLLVIYALTLSLLACMGVVFERTLPGLWILAYSALLSASYCLGIRYYKDEAGWENPLKLIAMIGISILCYLFTWTHFWDEIGWNYYRSGWRYQEWGIWLDSGMTLALIIAWALVVVRNVNRNSVESIALSAFPLVAGLAFFLASATPVYEVVNALIFNAYFLFLGLLYVALGCRELKLRKLNGGMILVTLLITTRFFDDEFGFMARGLAFIFLGICFLIANVVIARKKKEVAV